MKRLGSLFLLLTVAAISHADTLTTNLTPNDGGYRGLFFDLTPKKNIVLNSIDAAVLPFFEDPFDGTIAYGSVFVFVRQGTYVGHDGDGLGTAFGVSGPVDTGISVIGTHYTLQRYTLPGGLALTAGQTYGFYLNDSDRFMYRSQSSTYSDADLTFTGGAANTDLGDFSHDGYSFSGRFNYTPMAVPEPSCMLALLGGAAFAARRRKAAK